MTANMIKLMTSRAALAGSGTTGARTTCSSGGPPPDVTSNVKPLIIGATTELKAPEIDPTFPSNSAKD